MPRDFVCGLGSAGLGGARGAETQIPEPSFAAQLGKLLDHVSEARRHLDGDSLLSFCSESLLTRGARTLPALVWVARLIFVS